MHIHILGICGTFMGGIAQIAQQAGHRVTGSDENVYPPMSQVLADAGIDVIDGYDPSQLDSHPDLVLVGNVMSRGRPIIEALLNRRMRYSSGPQWLGEQVLQGKWVAAVAGTHGKTTTSSMLAWMAEDAGLAPGFLIGGVAENFGVSARLGDAQSGFFVIEADEYDTAFFDKRSKFVHYRPTTAILNNLEFDHADIFPDLAAIERQFHHFVRTVPGNGLVIRKAGEPALDRVMKQGCWSPVERFGGTDGWHARDVSPDGSEFEVCFGDASFGTLNWKMLGLHNVANALAAISAARHMGIPVEQGIDSLSRFISPKRRMELRGSVQGVDVYDDFAHHPTAIQTTVAGLRAHRSKGRLLAVFEPRSNTMRMGVHQGHLADSWSDADFVFVFEPGDLGWDLRAEAEKSAVSCVVETDIDGLVRRIVELALPDDAVLVMSNGGFGGIHEKLLSALEAKA